MANPWLVLRHDFQPMPEREFRDLCMVCGGRRFNSPHPGNVTELPAPKGDPQ